MPDEVVLLLKNLREKFAGDIRIEENAIQKTLWVEDDELVSLMLELKQNSIYSFRFLVDVTAVDEKEHFVVVYHLMSLKDGELLRVKVKVDRENPEVPSLTSIWPAANVLEREVYDLMGVVFKGHPNLKRILCPDDFQGHPLRKDYKVGERADRFPGSEQR